MTVPPRVHLRLSGRFGAVVAGCDLAPTALGSRRGRLLLRLLCAARGAVVDTDTLVATLWPDGPPERPEAAIAVLVSRLRRVLGGDAILGGRGSYRLGTTPAVEVDLDVVGDLLTEAQTRLGRTPALAAAAASRALDLLGEEALAEERYADWAAPVRAEHTGLLRQARHLAAVAALATGDTTAAVAAARAATDADPLDEQAHRDLMSAWNAAGEPAEALAVHARLRERLADDLGIDPSAATEELHLAILRSQQLGPQPGGPAAGGTDLPGRAAEVAHLEYAWERAVAGRSGAVFVIGESGIGKTRLAGQVVGLATRTGGQVAAARCYESERSLFLQPVVDALTPALTRLPAPVLADLLEHRVPALADLFPALVGEPVVLRGSDEERRRRTFDALAELVARLAQRAPVLLFLDDLHDGGRSTMEWLEYLLRHAPDSRLLVVATIRVEHLDRARSLAPVAERVDLGPLDRDAVGRLTAEAGLPHLTDEVLRRSSGHPLYVVELLHAAATGDGGAATDLRSAVLDRVARLGPDTATLLRGAAVLGAAVDPDLLVRLLDRELGPTTAGCEAALAARLLTVVGPRYEFAHDLVREVLYADTPEPTRVALHRRAATVLAGQPEAVARHAAAAGDHVRAARAGLRAAEDALRRLTPSDAAALATQALAAAETAGEQDLVGRALLLRAVARERAADFTAAHEDLRRAVTVARSGGDRRLELQALRHLGGDIASAVGQPITEYVGALHEALPLATSLGDRAMEVELLGRLAILDVSRLRFSEALDLGRRAMRVADAAGEEQVRAVALDGLKTALAYLGETAELATVVAELEPLLRRAIDPWLLPWTVFEAAFVPLAGGDFDAAERRLDEAVELCRGYGYPGYVPWFLTHRAWAARLAGDLPGALEHGRRAVELAEDTAHTWWDSTALAVHAVSLLEAGDRAGAVRLLERALPLAAASGAEGYRLRVLAPLAEATGSAELLAEASDLLAGIDAPREFAWVLGADAYLAVARALLRLGRSGDAAAAVGPLGIAVRRLGWRPLLAPVAALETATGLQRPAAR